MIFNKGKHNHQIHKTYKTATSSTSSSYSHTLDHTINESLLPLHQQCPSSFHQPSIKPIRALLLSLGVLLASTGGLVFTSSYAIAAGASSHASTQSALQTVNAAANSAPSSTSNTALADPTVNTVIQTQTQVYEGKHFRFYYPPAWKTGIKVEVYHPPGMDTSEVVDFTYNGNSLLNLMAVPRAEWNAQLPDEVPYGYRIAANGNYIYAINLPQDSVYDPTSKEYPAFHKRVLTMEQVQLMFQGK